MALGKQCAIPAKSEEQRNQNVLQIALKTTIKLFYRPANLKGTLPEAVEKLQWRAEGGKLTVHNPSGYNVVVSELLLAWVICLACQPPAPPRPSAISTAAALAQ